MHIKKIGHCCLVIEIDGTTIVTDPGTYTTAQNDLSGTILKENGIVFTPLNENDEADF